MKVLILSCSTGGGHNAAGRAIKEYLEYSGHEAVMMDPFVLSDPKLADRVGNLYVTIAKHIPRFFGFIYRLGGVISSSRHKSPVYFANIPTARKLRKYLEENTYDAIVMPHLYPAEMVTYLRRKNVPLPLLIAVATDYTCIPFWEETRCDFYIAPHEDLLAENIKRGLPAEKLLPFGIPVSMGFSRKSDKAQAKARLKLPADQPVYLVMSGSMGFGKMHLFVFELVRKLSSESQLIIICGNNTKMLRILKHTYRRHKNVHITGFTEHVSDYMEASDVVFTKPGGLSSTEALVKNVPIVHTAAIPGCENKNREFFVTRGLSLASEHTYTQVSQGITLVTNQALREAMITTQKQYAKPNACADIVNLIKEKTFAKDEKEKLL